MESHQRIPRRRKSWSNWCLRKSQWIKWEGWFGNTYKESCYCQVLEWRINEMFRTREPYYWFLIPWLISSGILGKLPNFPKPQFCHLLKASVFAIRPSFPIYLIPKALVFAIILTSKVWSMRFCYEFKELDTKSDTHTHEWVSSIIREKAESKPETRSHKGNLEKPG